MKVMLYLPSSPFVMSVAVLEASQLAPKMSSEEPAMLYSFSAAGSVVGCSSGVVTGAAVGSVGSVGVLSGAAVGSVGSVGVLSGASVGSVGSVGVDTG